MKTLVNTFRRALLLVTACAITIASVGVEASAQITIPDRTVLEQRLHSFLAELNLTDAQKAQIETILREERPAVEPHVRQLIATLDELRAATRGGRFDEAQIRALTTRLTPTVTELIVARERILSKIYHVLTLEQRALFERKRAELAEKFTSFSATTPDSAAGRALLQIIAARLNLSQMQQLSVMLIVAFEYPRIGALVGALSDAQAQMRAATEGGKFEEAQVRAIATRQAQSGAELVVAAHGILSKVYAVLTPEQRAVIESMLDAFAARLRGLLDSVSIDNARFFVIQHYMDFLRRQPDPAGLAFWTNQIEECGTDPECRRIRRINVSAAFFLSIEFQQTGYLVYRLYQAAYNTGERVRFGQLLPDTQQMGRGVVIGAPNWEQQLAANTQAFLNEFVNRPEFLARYPLTLSAAQFINALSANTGGSLSQAERDSLVTRLAAGQITRSQALREVAEDTDFRQREFNRAFVLMQYFGYLRRNPDDAPDTDFSGYNFWLQKLINHGGNFVDAQMVEAFIVSGEYRRRFGQ